MALLPTKLIEEIRELRSAVDPKVYSSLCHMIFELDIIDLLNDQIWVSTGSNDDDVCVQWPHYGLFLDLEKRGVPDGISCDVHHVDTRTSAKNIKCESALALISSVLDKVLDKNDVHDEYRKEKRSTGNSVMCYKDVPF